MFHFLCSFIVSIIVITYFTSNIEFARAVHVWKKKSTKTLFFKGFLKRGKFLGGGWVIKEPIGMEIPEWCGDANQNVFRGVGGGGGEYGYFLEPHNSDWELEGLVSCWTSTSEFLMTLLTVPI